MNTVALKQATKIMQYINIISFGISLLLALCTAYLVVHDAYVERNQSIRLEDLERGI